jgi:hypothetical protein
MLLQEDNQLLAKRNLPMVHFLVPDVLDDVRSL